MKMIKGLFKEKIRLDILADTITEHRVLCVCSVLLLAALITVLCVSALTQAQPEVVRYELETISGKIDFAVAEDKTHTAADGVAVVGTVKAADNINPAPVPASAEPAKLTSDPNTIWQAETTPAPTYGGFTLPVQMDRESIGVLTIPDVGLTVRVYESGNEMEDMTKGASHFKSTSAWIGNIGLSAHNINLNGSAGYFLNLYKLQKGAVIQYETALGKREYKVESVKEISETDWSMLGRTEDNRITLITCITGKPSIRLCVQGIEK